MTKLYATGLAALVFGGGLVSGMLVQHLREDSASAPAPANARPAAPAEPRETLAEMDARAARTRRAGRDESADWLQPTPETRTEPAASPVESGAGNNGENGRPPWERGAWTNREAWLEQRRAEREARAGLMRSNLVKQANLNEQQAVRFDVLVTAMNLRLEQQARIWREALDTGAMSRPEVRARAMKEIGTVVALTYDELDRNMPSDWRTATTNESVNLWTFIDPEIWQQMRPMMGGRPGGRPPP